MSLGHIEDGSLERDAAVRVIQLLRDRDHTAYLAGGCVRDMLLGYVPKDFDVATDARPEQIETYFRKTASVGAAFGVILVRDFGATIEVATFRSDGEYSDARRPDSIEYSTPEMDARRRDFTINALFLDPTDGIDGRVIDYVDGLHDVEKRVLRAVGDPDHRLNEDHLRALRAVRFAARYGLEIEAATKNAIATHALELRGVSVERIGEEMRRMLVHPSRTLACELIDELGLDDAIFGDICTFHPEMMRLLGEELSYPLALTSLAFGRGHDIDEDPEPVCAQYRARLDLSNADRDSMRSIWWIARSMHTDWANMGDAGKRRIGGMPYADDALRLYEAWCICRNSREAAGVRSDLDKWRESEHGFCPSPFIDGGDLIKIGLKPGPEFRKILDSVYDAQLENRVTTPEAALSLARELSQGHA